LVQLTLRSDELDPNIAAILIAHLAKARADVLDHRIGQRRMRDQDTYGWGAIRRSSERRAGKQHESNR